MPRKARESRGRPGRSGSRGKKADRSSGEAKLRLKIELVPGPLWRRNLRTILSRKEWEALRPRVIAAAGFRCEICGAGPPLLCHEVWEYDDQRSIQRLRRLQAVCRLCSLVQHIGQAGVVVAAGRVKRRELVSRFMNVNGVSRSVFKEHEERAFERWYERSASEWTQDLGAYGPPTPGAGEQP